ncbi:hypothetical protein [Flectobacillus major]|uniref:hypothetical protein n=1 Tax=Flectobacillus major TaxID=103 RepID=UPI000409E918|nr:hypothetical protein [Flectobacillus major]
MKVQKLSDSLFVLSSAVLQLTSRDAAFGRHDSLLGSTATEHIRWGHTDNMPNMMKSMIVGNNQVPAQLVSIRDMIYGSGVGFFKRVIDPTTTKQTLQPYTDTRLEDWEFDTDLPSFVAAGLNQFVECGNKFTRMVWSASNQWYRPEISDCFMTRIGSPTNGRIIDFHVNDEFGGKRIVLSKANSDIIPAFDFRDDSYNKKQVVTMLHAKEQIPGNPFYAYPTWWCAKEWIELANLIPMFHKSGIQNGYNIKYLIRMPVDYFDAQGGKSLDEKDRSKKWSDFSDRLSGWMAGQKNVNKSMIVKYLRGADGKMLDNVDVQPLKNEMSDDAYSKVWEMSNQSIANAMGILPTLAGVSPGKGNDSGSQIRVMADYQQHFRTPVPRMLVLKDIQYALRAMGYRDVIPAFKEVQITTLDTNPTGAQAVVNQAS